MNRPSLLASSLLALLFWGCGGTSSSGTPSARTGTLTFKVKWPSKTRLIPYDCAVIVATLTDSKGNVIGAPQTLDRPAQGVLTTSVSFSNLNPGSVTLSASSYPAGYPTGAGTTVAQASGAQSTSIAAGQVASVTVTMADTIAKVAIRPNPLVLNVGQSTQLTMTAYDEASDIVLVSPNTVTWASQNPADVTVSPTGLAKGVSAGNSTVTVTETESGKTATDSGTVIIQAQTAPSAIFTDVSGQHVYSVDSEGSGTGLTAQISQFSIGSGGSLSPLNTPVVLFPAANEFPVFGTPIYRTATAAYIPGSGPDGWYVYLFAFQTDATLKALSPVRLPGEPAAIGADPTGKFLYVSANTTSGPAIFEFTINADGSLTASGSVTGLNGTPNSIAAIPGTAFVAMSGTGLSTYGLTVFAVGSGGSLSVAQDYPNKVPVYDLAATSDGTLYELMTNGASGTQLTSNRVASDGTVTGLSNSGTIDASHPLIRFTISPNEQFAYVVDLYTSSIVGYSLQSDAIAGQVSPIGPIPAGPSQYVNVVVSGGSKYAYGCDYYGNDVLQFAVEGSGGLVPLDPATIGG